MTNKDSPLVAVVTGAASGIGRSLASKCLKEGMCVVLADIDKDSLISTSNHFKSTYGDSKILASIVDVSQLSHVQRLAKEVIERFGKINFLFNNAGTLSISGSVYKATDKEWQWIINVNLFGVIHGLQVFVPLMLQQPKDEKMHIINTSSISGVFSGACFPSPYTVSKHGVVALSESLASELTESSIKVHVLLPGGVITNILDSYRNGPQDLLNEITVQQQKAMDDLVTKGKTQLSRIHPDTVAEKVFESIAQNQFYIFTHPPESLEGLQCVIERFKDITENRQPKPLQYFSPSNAKL